MQNLSLRGSLGPSEGEIFSFAALPALNPGQYALILGPTFDDLGILADGTHTGVQNFAAGGVALMLAGNPTPIDAVGVNTDGDGYGEGTFLAPLTAAVDQGYRRKVAPGGVYTDNNSNASDF